MKFQVLTNGIEVKLQRNALSVIEAPTGHEEDDEIGCENMQWNVSDMGEPSHHILLSLSFFLVFNSYQSSVFSQDLSLIVNCGELFDLFIWQTKF